jgi:hypothetical protein
MPASRSARRERTLFSIENNSLARSKSTLAKTLRQADQLNSLNSQSAVTLHQPWLLFASGEQPTWM